MINIPRWLVFLVAFWVIVFGAFRIYIAKQKLKEPDPDRPNFRKGGLYAQSRRRHIVFGCAYLLLGAVLVAMGFGVKLPIYGDEDSPEATQPEATSIELGN